MLQSQSRKSIEVLKCTLISSYVELFLLFVIFTEKVLKQFDCIVEKQKKGVRGVCAEQFRVVFRGKSPI